jgi:uncharacterized protein YjbI with pentapeptide repeats
MIQKVKLFSAILIGTVVGWTLEFYRIPTIHPKQSFLTGFLIGITLISLLFLVFKFRWIHANGKVWMIISIMVFSGSILSVSWVYFENDDLRKRIKSQENLIDRQKEILYSEQVKGLAGMSADVMNEVKIELASNDSGKLSARLIQRIAALSHVLKPYAISGANDMDPQEILSPERGHLLLQLCFLPLDSNTFSKLKSEVSFAQADLSAVNLSGIDLSGINLELANLRDAILDEVNLEGAILQEACLWGAKLNNANLQGADLTRANLEWAEIQNANLTHCIINGAMLENAKLSNTTLARAQVQWAFLKGAKLEGANLEHADLKGADLRKANFHKANLSQVNLTLAKVNEASFVDVNFHNTRIMEDNWLDLLISQNVDGAEQIGKLYSVEIDTTKRAKHRLQKISL